MYLIGVLSLVNKAFWTALDCCKNTHRHRLTNTLLKIFSESYLKYLYDKNCTLWQQNEILYAAEAIK
jgi:hypothetical protein